MDRRRFVQASLTSLAAAGLPGEAPVWGQTGLVRRDVTTTAAAGDLEKYRRAVTAMKGRPASDPLSWEYWAQIHNNYCPHTNWWFLPWHRVYVFYFEQVCQTLLNNDTTFRLPYWNWSANNNIPAPFQDRNSILFDSTRRSSTVSPEAVNQALIDRIVRSPSELDLFSGATVDDNQRGPGRTGLFEGTPHNTVHRNIGGNMGQLISPRDPIFWLHHCNIDRIWASWQRIAGHTSPAAPLWNRHVLTTFYDSVNRRQATPVTSTVPNGQFVRPYDRYVVVQNALRTRSLSFREFGMAEAPGGPESATSKRLSGTAQKVNPVSLGSGETVAVSLGGLQSFGLKSFQDGAGLGKTAAAGSVSESYLLIEDIPWPTDPDVSLRVFLNAAHPTPATPVSDPSYVGTISFFGMPMNNTFALNVTAALARELAAGDSTVQVGLVAVDLLHPNRVSPEVTVRPASLRIVALNERL